MKPELILALVAAALFCGVLASWLGGVLFHVRIQRKSYTASRRLTRILVPVSPDQLVQHMARSLNNNPHFIATLTGRMEGILHLGRGIPIRFGLRPYQYSLPSRTHREPGIHELAITLPHHGPPDDLGILCGVLGPQFRNP